MKPENPSEKRRILFDAHQCQLSEEETEQVPYGPSSARASPAGPLARPAVPPASSGRPDGP